MPSFGRTWQVVARILVSGGENAEMQLGGCRWIALRRRCLEQDVVKLAKFFSICRHAAGGAAAV